MERFFAAVNMIQRDQSQQQGVGLFVVGSVRNSGMPSFGEFFHTDTGKVPMKKIPVTKDCGILLLGI